MTKEEIRNMVNDAIYERIQEAINAYKEGLDSAIKEKDWDRASKFDACIYDYDVARECILSVVDEVFDKIEVGNDSLYKEKWEKLKNYIKGRESSINEDIKLCIEGTNYGTAYTCQMHRDELQNIAYEMEYIERNTKYIERGIE